MSRWVMLCACRYASAEQMFCIASRASRSVYFALDDAVEELAAGAQLEHQVQVARLGNLVQPHQFSWLISA